MFLTLLFEGIGIFRSYASPWSNSNPWYDLLSCSLCNSYITSLFESKNISYLVKYIFLGTTANHGSICCYGNLAAIATKTSCYNCGIWIEAYELHIWFECSLRLGDNNPCCYMLLLQQRHPLIALLFEVMQVSYAVQMLILAFPIIDQSDLNHL